ncbi:hypothetical protein BC827DRAFT_1186387 [Russula dissimulans]|nr:hypothetical protein BC827DRAFT_1186387 [Russula dissimulans]
MPFKCSLRCITGDVVTFVHGSLNSSSDTKEMDSPEDPLGLHKSVDRSEGSFSVYPERSYEDDIKITEQWKGESDAILIFTGLLSVALAALISVSIQDLRPSSQDSSTSYLVNIYHRLADSDAATPQPSTLAIRADPPKFSPPRCAVLANSLWFLSLVMTLTGALLVVFIRQWAQTCHQPTQRRHGPLQRAQIRTFHSVWVDKWRLRVIRAVPMFLLVSPFLFLSGLPLFLYHVNHTVFRIVLMWIGLYYNVAALSGCLKRPTEPIKMRRGPLFRWP